MTYEEEREIEKQEERDFQEIIKKIAPLITINGNWTYQPSDRGNDLAYLIGNGQAKIWVKWDTYHKRIIFTSLYPNNRNAVSCKNFEITVSPKKDPSRIVKDIENRFLPDYLPELQKVIDLIKKHNDYEEERKGTIKKVSDFLNIPVHENGNIYIHSDSIYCIKSYSGKKVSFEIQCYPEEAIEVLKTLEKFRPLQIKEA